MRTVEEILGDFPFSGRYKDRQEDVLAMYLYEKLGGTRKDGYEAADISETAAINIDEAWNSLKPRERTRLMQYLSTRYEELAEHDGGENPE